MIELKCESCHQTFDRLMFRITFSNGAWFNVCERCTPVPGETEYQVDVFDLIALRERDEEQST